MKIREVENKREEKWSENIGRYKKEREKGVITEAQCEKVNKGKRE